MGNVIAETLLQMALCVLCVGANNVRAELPMSAALRKLASAPMAYTYTKKSWYTVPGRWSWKPLPTPDTISSATVLYFRGNMGTISERNEATTIEVVSSSTIGTYCPFDAYTFGGANVDPYTTSGARLADGTVAFKNRFGEGFLMPNKSDATASFFDGQLRKEFSDFVSVDGVWLPRRLRLEHLGPDDVLLYLDEYVVSDYRVLSVADFDRELADLESRQGTTFHH